MKFEILKDLEQNYGDSFYLLDIEKFKKNYNEFIHTFCTIYPNSSIGYSYKTNYIPTLCKAVDDMGGYAEVVSEMEYDLAIKIGVSPDKIIVNGPYKSSPALEKFLHNGSIVNLDSYQEYESLKKISARNPERSYKIGLRCNFELEHEYISRFGFDTNKQQFKDMLDEITKLSNIQIQGIHCHFPHRSIDTYQTRVEKILKLSDDLFDTPPEYIDIGGGYFGKMPDSLKQQFNVDVPDYQQYANVIAPAFLNHFKQKGIEISEMPTLFLEPGSALVADVMEFVTKVIDIKEVSTKNIVMTAGSKFNMGLLTSPINMPMMVISDQSRGESYSKQKKYDVSGFTCIESDYLFKDYYGNININDYLVFKNVGSYSVVFKPPFILPNVPVIESSKLSEGHHEVIKRQETFDDVFATYFH